MLAGAFLPSSVWLRPIGSAYVMLLQIVVYPYVICSLIHGLGRLDQATSGRFIRRAAPFFVLSWVLTFATLWALHWGLPVARVVTLDFTAANSSDVETFLRLLIPANVFVDLGSNYVPAVVIFSLLFGFAIQGHPKKESLLRLMEVIKGASVTIWNWCVQLSPLAIFSMLASTVASVSAADLERLALYMLLFLLGAGIMTFWTLPWLLSSFLPVAPGRLLREIRSALVIAAVTTLSVAALPLLSQAMRKLCDELDLQDEKRDELLETALAISYPLGQLGNFFVYLFLLFGASYYHDPLNSFQASALPPLCLLSCIGSPSSTVNAVEFLRQWLGFPDGAGALYVQTMVVTRYGQVLVSVCAFALLTLGPVFAYYGRLVWRPGRALLACLVPLLVAGVAAVGLGELDNRLRSHRALPWMDRYLRPEQENVRVQILLSQPKAGSSTSFDTARHTKVLRVGYSPTVIPFCYWNDNHRLVGFDVSMAYRLASDLGVSLEFVPLQWDRLHQELESNLYDVAMSGVYVTPGRLRDLGVTPPYYHNPWAVIVPSDRAAGFTTIDKLQGQPVTVFRDQVMLDFVREMIPGSAARVVESYEALPAEANPSPALWTFQQAGAFAAAHPGFSAVRPQGLGEPVLFAYMTRKDSPLLPFLSYWLQQIELQGFTAQEKAYWLDGRPRNLRP